MTAPISIVYFGTPAYAEPALRALASDARVAIRLVVTQPDRPGGRGHRLIAPRVKLVAEELGLSIHQPESLREAASREPLAAAEADVFVVAAYGLIFGAKTLALPRRGCLNLHASILPTYRGAAPIPAAILAGDDETGVTLMEMEAGLDTGPIVAIARTAILEDDTTATLTERLGALGGALVVEMLPRWVSGTLIAKPQGEGASAVRTLTKADGSIDWSEPAEAIARRVRAMWPWPRAWTRADEHAVQVHRVSVRPGGALGPGQVAREADDIVVGTGEGRIVLEIVQPPSGRPMPAGQAVSGGHMVIGTTLTGDATVGPPLVRPV